MPAVIGGPHGRFSHWNGTDRQVWIAGGVGVAPFLSWLRALDGHLPHRVDFFYTNDGEAPFAEEIRSIAGRHESLHAHLIDTGVAVGSRRSRSWPSPTAMRAGCRSSCAVPGHAAHFQTQLRQAGVPPGGIHREYFDWR